MRNHRITGRRCSEFSSLWFCSDGPDAPLGKTETKDWHKLLGGNTWQDVATFQHVIT